MLLKIKPLHGDENSSRRSHMLLHAESVGQCLPKCPWELDINFKKENLSASLLLLQWHLVYDVSFNDVSVCLYFCRRPIVERHISNKEVSFNGTKVWRHVKQHIRRKTCRWMTCHLTTYQYDDWLLNNVGISRTTCWWTMYHYNDLF